MDLLPKLDFLRPIRLPLPSLVSGLSIISDLVFGQQVRGMLNKPCSDWMFPRQPQTQSLLQTATEYPDLFSQCLDCSFCGSICPAVSDRRIFQDGRLGPLPPHLILYALQGCLTVTLEHHLPVPQLHDVLDHLCGSVLMGEALLRDHMSEQHPSPPVPGHLDGNRLLALGPKEPIVEHDLWHPLLVLLLVQAVVLVPSLPLHTGRAPRSVRHMGHIMPFHLCFRGSSGIPQDLRLPRLVVLDRLLLKLDLPELVTAIVHINI